MAFASVAGSPSARNGLKPSHTSPTASSASPASSASRRSGPASRSTLLLFAISGLVLVLDQFTKGSLAAAIAPGTGATRIEIAGDWLALEYAENRGAAFGLLGGLAPILAIASAAIIAALLLQYYRGARPPTRQAIAVGCILGGAVGNLLDRVRLGYVVDFVSIGAWPNFNVADTAITIGVIALAWGWSGLDRRRLSRRTG